MSDLAKVKAPLEFDPQRHLLGIDFMDQTHREFIELLSNAAQANKKQFVHEFHRLLEHTRDHFERENVMMQETAFPATGEHKDEHRRVLHELNAMLASIARGHGALARAYVCEHMPEWFELHAATMDSALAAHLKQITLPA
jgi:hemerythrin-like metal-binding protein